MIKPTNVIDTQMIDTDSTDESSELQEQLALFEIVEAEQRRQKGYSNSVDLYDNIPKYSWDQRDVEDMQDAKRVRTIKLGGQVYQVQITPAVITRDKRQVMVFPGVREELVEDALRKFVVEGQGVTHGGEVGVMFSMYQLQKELANNGRTFSLTELQEALQVCSKAHLEITTPEGKQELSSTLFPVAILTKRRDYLRAPTEAKCYVRFNPLVTDSIMKLKYRRYDYRVGMSIKSHLARWIHRRMSHNWTQASVDTPYTFSQISYLSASPRGVSEVMSENTRAVKTALNALIKHEIISHYESIPQKEGRKIVDIRYRVFATEKFVSQMISHNQHKKLLSQEQFKVLSKTLQRQNRLPKP